MTKISTKNVRAAVTRFCFNVQRVLQFSVGKKKEWKKSKWNFTTLNKIWTFHDDFTNTHIYYDIGFIPSIVKAHIWEWATCIIIITWPIVYQSKPKCNTSLQYEYLLLYVYNIVWKFAVGTAIQIVFWLKFHYSFTAFRIYIFIEVYLSEW